MFEGSQIARHVGPFSHFSHETSRLLFKISNPLLTGKEVTPRSHSPMVGGQLGILGSAETAP